MPRLAALFSRHNLRRTPQREAIYRALASTKSHPTAEELFCSVRATSPRISLATVYNTLDAFARRGLCRRLAPTDASGTVAAARFDADVSNHIHLASDDGHIRDVPPDLGREILESLPADLLERVEQRMGARIDAVRVEFAGRTVGGGPC